ncbi:hypothetical protein DdX_13305 [Ditylenchus destructor]|uniref:Uncharacterized protein n=1 Tax=Ditylenchus destructor TaxID=166010 RepID=A0AAD4MZ06_9BILA|nr:hypothetical protein DdX_13305 [Ditylenchus destructor]
MSSVSISVNAKGRERSLPEIPNSTTIQLLSFCPPCPNCSATIPALLKIFCPFYALCCSIMSSTQVSALLKRPKNLRKRTPGAKDGTTESYLRPLLALLFFNLQQLRRLSLTTRPIVALFSASKAKTFFIYFFRAGA